MFSTSSTLHTGAVQMKPNPASTWHDWFLPEILFIINLYSNQTNFANLCLACRGLHASGVRALYSSIYLYFEWSDCGQLDALHQTVSENPELASYIKELCFENPRSPSRAIDDLIHLELISEIALKCPNIRSLHFSDEWNPTLNMDVFLNTFDSLPKLEQLSCLFEIRFMAYETNVMVDYNISTLAKTLTLPSLKDLTIQLEEGQEGWTKLPTSLTPSNITKLSLLGAYSMKALGDILSAVPSLKQLEIGLMNSHTGPGTIYYCHEIDCNELNQALLPFHDSLERLDISVNVGNWTGDWNINHHLTSLPSFTKLKQLSLSAELILGQTFGVPLDIKDRLPTSLESLYLINSWNAAPFERSSVLHHVVQKYVESIQPGKLRDLSVSWSYRSPSEQVRRYIEQRCDSLGIKLTWPGL